MTEESEVDTEVKTDICIPSGVCCRNEWKLILSIIDFSLSLYVMCVKSRRAMPFMILQKMDRFAVVLPDLIKFTGLRYVLVFKNSVVCAIMHGKFEKSCNLDVHVFTAIQVLCY